MTHPVAEGRRGVRGRLVMIAEVVVVALLVTAARAYAADPPAPVATVTTVGQVLDNIRNWIMGIAAGAALLFITIGALRRMFAGTEPGEIEASNRAFKSAAWGFGVALCAPMIVEILKSFVGAK
jgi:hypothetical protein